MHGYALFIGAVIWPIICLLAAGICAVLAAVQYQARRKSRKVTLDTIRAIMNALDAKNPYKAGHSYRVAIWSVKLASYLHYGREHEVYYAALLHDIGKLELPDKLLAINHKPSPDEEKNLQKHPKIGAKLTAGITEIPDVRLAAMFHHERFDGTGYPEGLSGENIPMIARIVAAADAYDAMAHERATRGALERGEILRQFRENSGTQFDPRVAKAMTRLIADEACRVHKKGENDLDPQILD